MTIARDSRHAHHTLGDLLIGRGLVSADQLHIAQRERARTGQPLGRPLVDLGFVAEAALRQLQSESQGRESVDLAHALPDPEALALLPRALAERHRALPLAFDGETRALTLAMADADDIVALDRIRGHLGGAVGELRLLVAGEAEIERAIDAHYGHELSIDGILHELETGSAEHRPPWPASERHGPEDYGQPVVRLIDALLADAARQGASDIHFEPEATFLRIRYRIDGLLRQVRMLHKSHWPAMAVRLKVVAGMDIAESRAPQDGRATLTLGGRPVDFRASSQPTLHGENLVLRILDRHKGIVPLDGLGMSADQLAQLETMIARPEGLILFTGPTGSGKTTTLYSILSHLNRPEISIMTLEDPVEYPLPLVRQTSVAESGLDFATGIRTMMRQDPDVILVGEIRDSEGASMAFRAAMTGHQVYSTLHANSALGAFPRLIDIGVSPGLLAGNVIGVVSQRLVRRLCPHCKTGRPADARERRLLGLAPDAPIPLLYRSGGCTHCGQQGYRGRLAVMEVLRMNEALEEQVAARAPQHALREAARSAGFRSLAEDGTARVLAGDTALDELARVADLTGRL